MRLPSLLVLSSVLVSTGWSADLIGVPMEPIGRKKELLFSDDFNRAPAKEWHKVVETFSFEKGVLKGTQTRDKPDGHAATEGLSISTRDCVVEMKIRFEGATMMDVEFDDRAYTGSHYGHICRAKVALDSVTLMDEREGNQRNDIVLMKSDPAQMARAATLLEGRSASFPVQLKSQQWYTLGVEIAGEAMRVTLDGQPVGFLQSPGIGHPTKSKIEFGVGGKSGLFDDVKVWNAEPSPSLGSFLAARKPSSGAAQSSPPAAALKADQSPMEVLKEQGPNAIEWALAPLEQAVPGDIRQNLTSLREDLLDEGKQTPKASAAAYALGSQVCNAMLAALEERNRALVQAGFRAVEAQARTGITSQALEARRNYKMSWPQFAREQAQRTELKSQAVNNATVMAERVKVEWADRTAALRRSLEPLYAQFREALRQSALK